MFTFLEISRLYTNILPGARKHNKQKRIEIEIKSVARDLWKYGKLIGDEFLKSRLSSSLSLEAH